jgi:hypothetical protein
LEAHTVKPEFVVPDVTAPIESHCPLLTLKPEMMNHLRQNRLPCDL